MIATLSGIVSEKITDVVVLEAGGVGYGLLVTNEDYGRLHPGQPAKVYIYEHIREQSHDLFGFVTLDTKQLFELLLGVNGVGPKMALNIMSIGTSNEVRSAIATGDVKYITLAAGVGKRVGERVIVELKDKVGLPGVDLATTGILQGESTMVGDEAAQALIALGYSPQDAMHALKDIDPSLSTEERITKALKAK